ncbi:Hsp90-like protein [Blastocystis sp. ATCC 50177/Nand II]|uniref:Hsp90-like protein n=1 Tax=Blastocystis sp. subtype 1 (strain ATCC 50177 / NandII) TaxID=478820 RepID=A0A196S6T7_BLAHN|nr:Hsp90-like protein [Blastocystis sp. ATCC 50177/Nand II]
MSKEGENPETKPIDSEYYQWSKQINESKKELERLGVSTAPTRIDNSQAVEELAPSHKLTSSAWNKAGTWEECDFSKWAQSRIPEIFKTGHISKNNYEITFPSVEKCDGQATYVFVKGKKRPGFDFSLRIKWKATCDSEEDDATGTVCIDDFSDTSDGDYEWSFKSNKSDENHLKAKSAVQASKGEIIKLLDAWINEFKNL